MNFLDSLDRLLQMLKGMNFWARVFSWKKILNLAFDANGALSELKEKLKYLTEEKLKLEQDIQKVQSEKQQINCEKLKQEIELESINKAQEEVNRENDSLKAENKKIQAQLMEKGLEISAISKEIVEKEKRLTENEGFEKQSNELKIKIAAKERELTEKEKRLTENEGFEKQSNELKIKIAAKERELTEKEKKISSLEQEKREKMETYAKNVEDLNKAVKDTQLEKQNIRLEEDKKREKNLQLMEKAWSMHEKNVEEVIRMLCQKHTIEYIEKEKVPFKGRPDNTIKICDEFIIFDAKSPKNPKELDNFDKYIKNQSDSIKKYTRQEKVKREIFLVVPTNVIESIKEKTKEISMYKVFVITIDSLETILLSLKKIEDYDFADQLTPEDRQVIFTTIGAMTHGIKRKIQVDHFFAEKFFELFKYKRENLRQDFLNESDKKEEAIKFNPPLDKTGRLIDESTLRTENKRISANLEIENENLKASAQIEEPETINEKYKN